MRQMWSPASGTLEARKCLQEALWGLLVGTKLFPRHLRFTSLLLSLLSASLTPQVSSPPLFPLFMLYRPSTLSSLPPPHSLACSVFFHLPLRCPLTLIIKFKSLENIFHLVLQNRKHNFQAAFSFQLLLSSPYL